MRIPELSDVVEVQDAGGKTFRAMVSAVETPGSPTSRVKVAAGTQLSGQRSQVLGRWLSPSAGPSPGCWAWPTASDF